MARTKGAKNKIKHESSFNSIDHPTKNGPLNLIIDAQNVTPTPVSNVGGSPAPPKYVSTIIMPNKPVSTLVVHDVDTVKQSIQAAHKIVNGDKADYDDLTDAQLAQWLSQLEYQETFNKLPIYYPEHDTKFGPWLANDPIYSRYKYTKHLDFFSAGGQYPVVLFRAGNQVGKSFASCYATAVHLTGMYPSWWDEEVHGHKFHKPIRCWLGADRADTLKKTVQVKMLGPVGAFGSGFIPRHLLDLDSLKDAKRTDTPITAFRVKHATGGFSTVSLKTYESGRKAWEAESVDLIALDEEPPMDIFGEALARLLATNGKMLLAFTPNEGLTPLVDLLTDHGDLTEGPKGNGKFYIVTQTVYESPHMTQDRIELLIAGLPAQHMKDARLRGIPSMGEGVVYPVNVEELLIDANQIPKGPSMAYCMAIDFGWYHPTGILWMGFDIDTDTYYVLDEYKVGQQSPEVHAQYIQLVDIQRKINFHKICDPSKGSTDPKSGRKEAQIYNDYELDFKDADNDVSGGIFKVMMAMQHGKLKISKHCIELVKELRSYMWKKGKIHKINDDLVDPLRYCLNEDVDNWSRTAKRGDPAGDIMAKLMQANNRNRLFDA